MCGVPAFGEHTEEVLRGLGIAVDERQALRAAGGIALKSIESDPFDFHTDAIFNHLDGENPMPGSFWPRHAPAGLELH